MMIAKAMTASKIGSVTYLSPLQGVYEAMAPGQELSGIGEAFRPLKWC